MQTRKCLYLLPLCGVFWVILGASSGAESLQWKNKSYDLYPAVYDHLPELPSPLATGDGKEFVIALTNKNQYAIYPVHWQKDEQQKQQTVSDTADFPTLARTGNHSKAELRYIKTITGRPLDEITRLARPGQLSTSGFLGANEDIMSILKADNYIVRKLGISHFELAKPLFHVLNMMDIDLDLNHWNMAHHAWEHVVGLYSHGNRVRVEAHDTKGGQQSIFNDGIEGAFWIIIERKLDQREERYLRKKYSSLTQEQFITLQKKLSSVMTSEMEPQYIMRYGFYEGHTDWRTDPIALTFIFGLKSV
ncbi:MAG: hypothetical protein EHM72_19375, partial [Calditrichaeota bacterium]